MDTSPCPEELITAKKTAQRDAALFSCVNFVISACLTIPDRYSIKEGFFLPSAALLLLSAKEQKPGGLPVMLKKREAGL